MNWGATVRCGRLVDDERRAPLPAGAPFNLTASHQLLLRRLLVGPLGSRRRLRRDRGTRGLRRGGARGRGCAREDRAIGLVALAVPAESEGRLADAGDVALLQHDPPADP